MTPNISIRESIQWFPGPAEEPTSTVVLTSEGRRFVDIRVLRTALGDGISSADKEPGCSRLSIKALDWGFAGRSSSEVETRSDGLQVTHAQWKHWVDSRHLVVDGIVDQGDMIALDAIRTLETGRMINPATGLMTDYKEIWRDEEAQRVGSLSRERRCVVLELDDTEAEARGMIIQLGHYCQGVLRIGTSFAAQRWKYESNGNPGSWKCEVRAGDLEIPRFTIMDEEAPLPAASTLLHHQGLDWRVVESSSF